MSEWKEYRLGELTTVIPGYAFKGKEFGDNGCRVVKIGDIAPPIVDVANCLKIPTSKINGLDKFKIQNGDFVLAMTGATLGKVGRYLSEETGYINQRVAKFENINGISDKQFLYYLITSHYVSNEIINRGLGSAQPNISGKDIESINVIAPDLPTQTAIAEILSSLDNKIELNNKINQELENLAQTLFKQWFIDFEFPDENGNPYKSSGGEMVDSELGQIPKGWEVFKIGEVLDLVSGYPFKGESFSKDGNYGIVTIKNVQDGLFVEQIDNYIDKLPNKFPANIRLTVGDILMSLTGNVGRVCYVTSDDCLLNQRVVKFNSVQENANAFWYYYFRQNVIKDLLISISKGTAQLNLSPVETKLLKCKLPRIIAPNILSAFDVIFRKQIECSMANKNLSKLRNTLLPKLISGELEVNQTIN
jgi:type I restriction enzyme S subunit